MNFVLVHGAWHRGELLENTAKPIRSAGHRVFLPTLVGNRPGDSLQIGLDEVISGLVDYFDREKIEDAVVVGHSFAGMAITGLADRAPGRIRRLVYWNAFVPNNGESLNDMVPRHYVDLFAQLERDDGGITLPLPIWREAFINDATLELAEQAYATLVPHPYKTFTDPIQLTTNPAQMEIAKSYVNCTEDTALPHSAGWHPRLSEKLGLFRLHQTAGSHELCFSDPERLAATILSAGQD